MLISIDTLETLLTVYLLIYRVKLARPKYGTSYIEQLRSHYLIGLLFSSLLFFKIMGLVLGCPIVVLYVVGSKDTPNLSDLDRLNVCMCTQDKQSCVIGGMRSSINIIKLF